MVSLEEASVLSYEVMNGRLRTHLSIMHCQCFEKASIQIIGCQASTWEQLAVLNEEQERVIDLVSQHCAERPLPQHVRLLPNFSNPLTYESWQVLYPRKTS